MYVLTKEQEESLVECSWFYMEHQNLKPSFYQICLQWQSMGSQLHKQTKKQKFNTNFLMMGHTVYTVLLACIVVGLQLLHSTAPHVWWTMLVAHYFMTSWHVSINTLLKSWWSINPWSANSWPSVNQHMSTGDNYIHVTPSIRCL